MLRFLFARLRRFCSGGVTAYESNLLAHGNKAEDIKYAAFHIFNGVASLEENWTHGALSGWEPIWLKHANHIYNVQPRIRLSDELNLR